jgi:hypothetical protein
MPAFSAYQRHWPVLGAFAQWWQYWSEARATELLEAARLGAGEVEYLTHDVDASESDFRASGWRWPNEANLLARRMVALDLDSYELALSEPALTRHLQSQCMLCDSRGRCLQDFEREAGDAAWQNREEWREYCPNASLLDMLSALKDCSKAAPKYSLPYLG